MSKAELAIGSRVRVHRAAGSSHPGWWRRAVSIRGQRLHDVLEDLAVDGRPVSDSCRTAAGVALDPGTWSFGVAVGRAQVATSVEAGLDPGGREHDEQRRVAGLGRSPAPACGTIGLKLELDLGVGHADIIGVGLAKPGGEVERVDPGHRAYARGIRPPVVVAAAVQRLVLGAAAGVGVLAGQRSTARSSVPLPSATSRRNCST